MVVRAYTSVAMILEEGVVCRAEAIAAIVTHVRYAFMSFKNLNHSQRVDHSSRVFSQMCFFRFSLVRFLLAAIFPS